MAAVTAAIQVTRKSQNLSAAASAVGNASAATIAALIPDAPDLWGGLVRKKRFAGS